MLQSTDREREVTRRDQGRNAWIFLGRENSTDFGGGLDGVRNRRFQMVGSLRDILLLQIFLVKQTMAR